MYGLTITPHLLESNELNQKHLRVNASTFRNLVLRKTPSES